LQAIPFIPRDANGPVFPAPWAARAFAMTLALHERGLFSWSEWAETLGATSARGEDPVANDAEAYWRAWLSALEAILGRTQLAAPDDLLRLQEAWRRAAERTPHGEPVELAPGA
jgi:nitrile hydratase accessory protein